MTHRKRQAAIKLVDRLRKSMRTLAASQPNPTTSLVRAASWPEMPKALCERWKRDSCGRRLYFWSDSSGRFAHPLHRQISRDAEPGAQEKNNRFVWTTAACTRKEGLGPVSGEEEGGCKCPGAWMEWNRREEKRREEKEGIGQSGAKSQPALQVKVPRPPDAHAVSIPIAPGAGGGVSGWTGMEYTTHGWNGIACKTDGRRRRGGVRLQPA